MRCPRAPWLRAVAVAGAVVALVAGTAGCGDDGSLAGRAREAASERADQARRAARDAGLGPDVERFLGIAAGVVGATYTPTYRTGDGGETVVTQRPPLRRVDVRGGSLPAGVTRSALVTADGSFACEQSNGIWTCAASDQEAPAVGPFAGGDLERAGFSLAQSRSTYDLRVEARQLLGTPATCLVATRKADAPADPTKGASGTQCVTVDGGVPLLIESTATLQATAFSTKVDDGVLRLPAAVVTTTTAALPP